MSPKYVTSALIRERHREMTNTQKRGGNVKMEAEIRVMQLQAKGCGQPPEARRGAERIFLGPPEGLRPDNTLISFCEG